MKNFIEYFYNIKIDKVDKFEKYYSFVYDGYIYKLFIDIDIKDINFLYNLNKQMLKSTLVSEIILNRNNEVVTIYNNNTYMLMKIYVNLNKNINLSEIVSLSNSLTSTNIKSNWGILWERKIDYLEDLIHENGKKYPLVVDSFNYFVGIAENAISYYNNIIIDSGYQTTISHKEIKLNDTIEALYNPLNIIFDYKVRDIAEYIKFSFFNNSTNLDKELDYFLKNNFLSIIDVKLLIARLLYPSFYFNLYEDIMVDGKSEKILMKIISKTDAYEIFLYKIINYLANRYKIDTISWLKKDYNKL